MEERTESGAGEKTAKCVSGSGVQPGTTGAPSCCRPSEEPAKHASRSPSTFSILSSPEDLLIDFRERGREGEREGEKHRPFASRKHPTGDRTYNLDLCPDREPNPRPFGLGDYAPTN